MHEPDVRVRKEHAGSASGGYTWPEDGAIIDVPYPLALELVKIPDGGYTIVEPGEEESAAAEITEPAPAAKASVTEPAPRRASGRKTPVKES